MAALTSFTGIRHFAIGLGVPLFTRRTGFAEVEYLVGQRLTLELVNEDPCL